MTYQTRLETAKRRVTEVRAIVLVQEKLVAGIDPSADAYRTAALTLERMRRTLEIFEREYEAALLEGQRA